MKSIFSALILCLTGLDFSSAQPVELTGVVGQKFTFPSAVRNSGTLMYGDDVIGDVTNDQSTTDLVTRFTGRLQWDRSTGFFSITGLKIEDKGDYKVNYEGGSITYRLKMFNMHPEVKPPVKGTVGGQITFPTTVKKGNLKHDSTTIADVQNNKITFINERFTGRVQWDSSTGFSITELKMEDSGVYIVQNNDEEQQQPDHIYHLSVTGSVSLDMMGKERMPLVLPAAVYSKGSLIYKHKTTGDVTIGIITSSKFRSTDNKKFRGRVQWDSSTGFFSITELKMEDEGEYEVHNEEDDTTAFSLTVVGSDSENTGIIVGLVITSIISVVFLVVLTILCIKAKTNPTFMKELKKPLIGQSDASSPVNRGDTEFQRVSTGEVNCDEPKVTVGGDSNSTENNCDRL